MKCKLCHKDKTPKPNTHYLSDFIIKTALNEDGSTIRNKGLIFSIDSQKGYIDFKFQQVSSEKIEEVLGRPSTEDENEDAKKRYDFAVSNSFCYDCEDKFTRIEVEFDNKLLKRFRGTNLTNIESIIFNKEESKILRFFFLLQFWRISVCEYTFVLPEKISEFLRIKILNYDLNDLEILPLAITYLETLPEVNKEDEGNKYKTGNMVNPLEGNN